MKWGDRSTGFHSRSSLAVKGSSLVTRGRLIVEYLFEIKFGETRNEKINDCSTNMPEPCPYRWNIMQL